MFELSIRFFLLFFVARFLVFLILLLDRYFILILCFVSLLVLDFLLLDIRLLIFLLGDSAFVEGLFG